MKQFAYTLVLLTLLNSCKPEHLRRCPDSPPFEFCENVNLLGDWTIDKQKAPLSINDIFFLDELIGYLCGRNGEIAQTQDGGRSWKKLAVRNEITTNELGHIFFLNEDYGWISEVNTSSGYFTINGGENWTSFEIPSATEITQIHFFSSTFGIASCETENERKLFTSIDSKNWNPLKTEFKFTSNFIIQDSAVCIISSEGNLHCSTNLR